MVNFEFVSETAVSACGAEHEIPPCGERSNLYRTTRNALNYQKLIPQSQNSRDPPTTLPSAICWHVCIYAVVLMDAPFKRGLALSEKSPELDPTTRLLLHFLRVPA
jgi:hypothetical protein